MAIAAPYVTHSWSTTARGKPRTCRSPSPATVAASIASARRGRKIQRVGRIQYIRHPPCCDFADAVTGNRDLSRHLGVQRRRGCERLQRTENLADPVVVQLRGICRTDQGARIDAAKERGSVREHRRGLGAAAVTANMPECCRPWPEHRSASVMTIPVAQCGNSTAMATAMVAMLKTVLAMTIDPIVAESSR